MMYRFLLKESSRIHPAQASRIEDLEKHLGHPFPAALKCYYMTYNGYKIKECTYTYEGRSFTVSAVIPLFETSMSAVRSRELLHHLLPASYFPIATDPQGDDYFIDLESGAVYLIPTDKLRKHIPAANSIEQFFALMQESLPETEEETALLHAPEQPVLPSAWSIQTTRSQSRGIAVSHPSSRKKKLI